MEYGSDYLKDLIVHQGEGEIRQSQTVWQTHCLPNRHRVCKWGSLTVQFSLSQLQIPDVITQDRSSISLFSVQTEIMNRQKTEEMETEGAEEWKQMKCAITCQAEEVVGKNEIMWRWQMKMCKYYRKRSSCSSNTSSSSFSTSSSFIVQVSPPSASSFHPSSFRSLTTFPDSQMFLACSIWRSQNKTRTCLCHPKRSEASPLALFAVWLRYQPKGGTFCSRALQAGPLRMIQGRTMLPHI